MLTGNREVTQNAPCDTINVKTTFDPDARLCLYTKKLHIRLAQYPSGTVLLAGSRPLVKAAYHFSICQATKIHGKSQTHPSTSR